ncbi:MAG: FAD-binding oxidoreductase [Candidatus Hydrogenedentota bacterium]|nr:MAG: FAD-binding oxidoreductase [Candidatus Hydrogenedentota bacterium]
MSIADIKPAVYDKQAVELKLQNLFGNRFHKAEEHVAERVKYSRDLMPFNFILEQKGEVRFPPDYIVWPKTEQEIVNLIAICREHKVPLVPYAGGSGVCGGAVPVAGGVVCDLKQMDKILEINDTDLTCTVEPGINGQLFEEELNRRGYTLGHFPSSIYVSTVGGWVATRAAGVLSTYYGKIEDMVLSLRVALGNGNVAETVLTPASATGPDFNRIFAGSEGTLGILTKITFRIHPLPQERGFFAVKAKNVKEGIEFMRMVMRRGLRPAAVRLYDELDTLIIGSPEEKSGMDEDAGFVRETLKKLKSGEGLKATLRWAAVTNRAIDIGLSLANVGCLLLFTFEGHPALVNTQMEMIHRLATEMRLDIKGEKPARYWWDHRYDVSYSSPAVFKEGAFLDTCEVSTTWSKLHELYVRVKDAVKNDVFIMAHFSHSYLCGNNIYFSIAGYADSPEESEKKYLDVWDKMMKVCLQMGASISHHHSVGMLKQKYLVEQMGHLYPIWQKIKEACDPDGIMNPGKLGL